MSCETSKFVLILRSLIFNLIFYPFSILYTGSLIFFYWLPRKKLLKLSSYYFEITKLFERHILNLRYELIGKQHVPKGACIIAMKHQSVWETLKILDIIDDPIVIYKKAVNWIPGLGWLIMRLDMISIDRSKGTVALKKIIQKAKLRVKENRQIMIYPQGTRITPGEKKPYKHGVAALYKALNLPVVPVAVNSGIYWPKESFIKYPGKITIKILEPIQPGMKADAMLKKLEKMIETESDKLL